MTFDGVPKARVQLGRESKTSGGPGETPLDALYQLFTSALDSSIEKQWQVVHVEATVYSVRTE